MGPAVASAVTEKLTATFAPSHLQIIDESASHGARGSETHFKVVVVSAVFQDVALLERHRKINDALAAELAGCACPQHPVCGHRQTFVQRVRRPIHALSIVAKTPEQWKASNAVPESPQCLGGSKR